MSLESLTVTFPKGPCLLELAEGRNHGQQASNDPRPKREVARKEKLEKWALLPGRQRKGEQRPGS